MLQRNLNTMSMNTPRPAVEHSEYSRLLAAAVVNKRFRQMLLADPARALAAGYAGESFHLAAEEKRRVASIRAASLEDFARQLIQIQNVPAMPVVCMAGD